MGGVVVGDDHHRPLGVGGAEFAEHVVGGAPRQQPSQRPFPGREVGCDPGRSRGAEEGSQQAASAEGGEAPERSEGRPDPERPPVGAVGGLGLDPGLGSERTELPEDPLGGPSFAVGGRGALDPLELLDQPPQPVQIR